jgi:hypothetical protein
VSAVWQTLNTADTAVAHLRLLNSFTFPYAWSYLVGLGSATPREISAAELAADGPADNVHVRVRGFRFGERYVVRTRSGRWEEVWIPLYPEGAADKPADVRILVTSSKVKNDQDFAALRGRAELVGVVTNAIESVPLLQRERLVELYGEIDFSRVWILNIRRTFPSDTKGWVVVSIGGGIILLGGYLGRRGRRRAGP